MNLFFCINAIMLLCVSGCQSESAQIDEVPDNKSDIVLARINAGRISSGNEGLTGSDAAKVAMLYQTKAETKSSAGIVKSVEPIVSESGEPLMFAVNFDDGYVLVSATKNNFPILAEIEHGTFRQKTGTGQDVLLRDMKELQSILIQNPEDYSSSKSSWREYEKLPSLPKTKANVNSDYYDMLDSYLTQWYNDGYNVQYLYNKPEDMPDDLYQSFCEDAVSEMGEVDGYPYMECAIITDKSYSQTTIIGPYLTTVWGQDNPYNSSDPLDRHLV